MNSLIIFTETGYLQSIIATLVFFIICGIFFYINQSKTGYIKGAGYLITALIIDFVTVWFEYNMEQISANVSLKILMSVSLLMRLLIMILLATTATKTMLDQSESNKIVGIATFIGCICIIYFNIISSNGTAINVFHNLFPAIGFAYLAAAFFTKCFRRHNSGALLGCIITGIITASLAIHISNEENFISQPWYTGIIGYVGLGMTLLLLIVDTQEDTLDKLNQKLNKYDIRIKEMVKLSPFPIVIARLSDDSILSANDNFLKLFGLKSKDIHNYRFRDFFVDADNRRLLNAHLEREQVIQDFEILVKAPESTTPFWLSTSANIIDYDYNPALYAAFQDITDRKKREDLLQNQATRDPLTSLYNRRFFEEEVNRRIAQHPEDEFSVFMIDADHFKNVNDTYGHKIGDKVLIALAQTAEKALRENDIVARYGGEEFVVYLNKSNAQEAKLVADRLREAISEIIVYSDANEEIKFTVSIGIASSQETQDLNKLIKMSDDALYKAKEGGRNRCEIYQGDKMPEQPETEKNEKDEENIHPAFSKSNNIEISLLGGILPNPEDIHK